VEYGRTGRGEAHGTGGEVQLTVDGQCQKTYHQGTKGTQFHQEILGSILGFLGELGVLVVKKNRETT
jgi:hypothetical protein